MPDTDDPQGRTETQVISLRYWAAARAAAGVEVDEVASDDPLSVAALRDLAIARHPDGDLARVIAACSVLVGEHPLGGRDPAAVLVEPGTTVEFLPPFAGG